MKRFLLGFIVGGTVFGFLGVRQGFQYRTQWENSMKAFSQMLQRMPPLIGANDNVQTIPE